MFHLKSLFISNGIETCRSFSSCRMLFKEVHHKLKLKGRKKSSQEWLQRQLADPYVKWAKVDQYRCRSAFKLLEMDDKYQFLAPGMCVVDCGAAPGSWTQVLVKRCNVNAEATDKPQGMVIAIDLSDIREIDGVTIFEKHDFTAPETQDKVKALLQDRGGAHAVVSDMAPSATGVKHLDHEAIVQLAYSALRFSLLVSRPGGIFLTKLWDGRLSAQLQSDISKYYSKVQVVKPAASRSDSAEMFLLAREFKGLKK